MRAQLCGKWHKTCMARVRQRATMHRGQAHEIQRQDADSRLTVSAIVAAIVPGVVAADWKDEGDLGLLNSGGAWTGGYIGKARHGLGDSSCRRARMNAHRVIVLS